MEVAHRLVSQEWEKLKHAQSTQDTLKPNP